MFRFPHGDGVLHALSPPLPALAPRRIRRPAGFSPGFDLKGIAKHLVSGCNERIVRALDPGSPRVVSKLGRFTGGDSTSSPQGRQCGGGPT